MISVKHAAAASGLIGGLILTALLAAGCGASGTPATAPAASASPAVKAAAVTCKQQFGQWKAAHTPTISQFKDSLMPFTTGTVTTAQAHALSSAAQAMTDIPVPACGDPKGFYGQAMANLVTAGEAASGGGALSELGAIGPMENASTLLTELSAELQQAIGSSQI